MSDEVSAETAVPEKEPEVTMGVGDGTANLYIHGSWEAVDKVRDMMIALRTTFNRERRLKERIRFLEQELADSADRGLLLHAAQRFKELEEQRRQDHAVIARLIIALEKNPGSLEAGGLLYEARKMIAQPDPLKA